MRYAESTKEAVRSLAAAGARPAEIRRELARWKQEMWRREVEDL